jgi:hypothetical protein
MSASLHQRDLSATLELHLAHSPYSSKTKVCFVFDGCGHEVEQGISSHPDMELLATPQEMKGLCCLCILKEKREKYVHEADTYAYREIHKDIRLELAKTSSSGHEGENFNRKLAIRKIGTRKWAREIEREVTRVKFKGTRIIREGYKAFDKEMEEAIEKVDVMVLAGKDGWFENNEKDMGRGCWVVDAKN